MDELYNDYLLKKKHINKRTIVNFSMRTIFWVENHSKCIKTMCLCLEVGFVDFTLKTDKVLQTDFVWCDMNDVTIPHAMTNIVYYVISFREGWNGFRKPQCGDLEHQITLCEMNSIKTNNIDGYMIIFSNRQALGLHSRRVMVVLSFKAKIRQI